MDNKKEEEENNNKAVKDNPNNTKDNPNNETNPNKEETNEKTEDEKSNENKQEKTEVKKEKKKKGFGIKFFSAIKSKFDSIANNIDKTLERIEKDKDKKKDKKNKEKPKEEKYEEMRDMNEEKTKEENNEDNNYNKDNNNNKDNETKQEEIKDENNEDNKKLNQEETIEKKEEIDIKHIYNLNDFLEEETPSEKVSEQQIKEEQIEKEENKEQEPVKEEKEEPTESLPYTEKEEEFTKFELNKLYERFHIILTVNKKYDVFTQELTYILENVAEFLIHGDKNDQSLVDLFISNNFLKDIFAMMGKRNRNINIQIIKFYSVLMTNLSEKNFNYFLENSDTINKIINEDIDPIDGDYLYYYINFIKALLFKINTDTIKFFFHEGGYTFPLLVNCLKFYNHPDSMISNTIRNIFLFILKMGHKPCIEYICTLPMISYFVFISCTLRDEIKTLDKKINKNKSEASTILHERICNDIMYFQDIFSINIEKVNFILTNCIFHFLILPVLCNSLIIKPDMEKKNNVMENFSHIGNDISVFDFSKNLLKDNFKDFNNLLKDLISKELSIYILNLFFKYIKNETFLNCLLSILFLPKIHYKIIEKIKTPTKDLYNYKGDYDSKTKNKIYLEKTIIENFNPSFMRGLLTSEHKTFNDLNKIEKKLIEKCKIAKVEYDLNMSVPFNFYLEIINELFSNNEMKKCREYHQIISEATGIQCGLSFHEDRKCMLYLINKNLKYIKSDFSLEKLENKYIDNIININFINEFKECKYLYLLLMYNYLFNQILNIQFVSKGLLSHIELLNPYDIHKNLNGNSEEENAPVLQVGDLLNSGGGGKITKKNLIKIVNFSNLSKVMYYKDFTITEFNLYDNQILSKYFYNGQTEYNSTILNVILNYLNRDDVLRPEIYLFLIKLINDLISFEEHNKKILLKLREGHTDIIKKIFVKNLERIVKILNKEEIKEKDLIIIYDFFWDKKNEEKKNYFEEYDKLINDFMEDCLFLLNKKAEDKSKSYSDKLSLFNSLDISKLEIKIRLYFIKLFFDIYDGVYNGKIKAIKIDEINDENKSNLKDIIINNFNKLLMKEENKDNKDNNKEEKENKDNKE